MYQACQGFVRANLKAPSTAVFPAAPTSSVVITQGQFDGVTVLKGYVDAQNGFGAQIRSIWACSTKFDPASGTWVNVSAGVSNAP